MNENVVHFHKIVITTPKLTHCYNFGSIFAVSIQTTMIQVTSSLVVTSDKINACSVHTQQVYLRAARVSVAARPRDQLNAKDADVTSLPN